MKTINIHQARALIGHHNIDGLSYVDKVSMEGCTDIIFKSDLSDQLYSFYYCDNDDPDLGITINTTKQSAVLLDDINNRDLDVEVAPVKKIPVTTYEYVRDDSNEDY